MFENLRHFHIKRKLKKKKIFFKLSKIYANNLHARIVRIFRVYVYFLFYFFRVWKKNRIFPHFPCEKKTSTTKITSYARVIQLPPPVFFSSAYLCKYIFLFIASQSFMCNEKVTTCYLKIFAIAYGFHFSKFIYSFFFVHKKRRKRKFSLCGVATNIERDDIIMYKEVY